MYLQQCCYRSFSDVYLSATFLSATGKPFHFKRYKVNKSKRAFFVVLGQIQSSSWVELFWGWTGLMFPARDWWKKLVGKCAAVTIARRGVPRRQCRNAPIADVDACRGSLPMSALSSLQVTMRESLCQSSTGIEHCKTGAAWNECSIDASGVASAVQCTASEECWDGWDCWNCWEYYSVHRMCESTVIAIAPLLC